MNCQRTFLFASGTDSIINFIYIKEKPLCTRLLSELLLVRHEENELQSNLYISFVFIDCVRGGLNVWVMWRTFTLFIVLIYTLLDLSFVLSCLWEFPLLLLRVSFPSLVSIFICFKYSNSRNNKAFNLVQHNRRVSESLRISYFEQVHSVSLPHFYCWVEKDKTKYFSNYGWKMYLNKCW